MPIPRKFHQTIRSKKNIPSVFLENISRLKNLNEGWDHELYDDHDIYEFISNHYDNDILKSYQLINPIYGAAKADFFRYLLLYKFGGVYLDIKSTATKKLDLVLNSDDHFLLSYWANKRGEPYEGWGISEGLGPPGEYQQWHIVASPQHPFLEEVITQVAKNIRNYEISRDGVGKSAVMRITGPIAYTLAIQRAFGKGSYRLVDIRELGFEYSILGTSGNSLVHERYFKNHYRYLSEPLVQPLRRNALCPCGSEIKYKHCHGKPL